MQQVVKCSYVAILIMSILLIGCVERNPAYLGNEQDSGNTEPPPAEAGTADLTTAPDVIVLPDAPPPRPCSSTDECGDGNYCYFEVGCGEDQLPGVCKARPEVCPEAYSPACGCDGVTYDNPCLGFAAGVSLFGPGECQRRPSCEELDKAYSDAIVQARTCKLMQGTQQCNLAVQDALLCPCKVHVNKSNKAAVNEAKRLREDFFNAGCEEIPCGRPCPFFNIGVCLPTAGDPQCQEV